MNAVWYGKSSTLRKDKGHFYRRYINRSIELKEYFYDYTQNEIFCQVNLTPFWQKKCVVFYSKAAFSLVDQGKVAMRGNFNLMAIFLLPSSVESVWIREHV